MKLNEKKISDFFKIINEKKIKSVFQPIVSLKTGEIVSFEALSRITLESCPINIEELFKIAKPPASLQPDNTSYNLHNMH